MIKICGDIHLGLRKGSSTFHNILKGSINWLISNLESSDHLIILGDIFDNRSSVDFKVLNDAIELFTSMSKKCKKIYILVGNHDLYYKENTINNVNCRFLKDIIKNIEIVSDLKEIKIEGQKCLFIPWIDNSDSMFEAKSKLQNKYDIVFGHFDTVGIYNGKNIDTSLMFEDKDFGMNTNVLSGHYHRRSDKGVVKYVGSLINQTFNDINDTKGYYTFDNNVVKFFEGVCPKFQYVTISNSSAFLAGYSEASSDDKEKIAKNITGNFIQLILNEYGPENDEIYRIFKGMTPLELSVSYNRVSFEDGADKEGFAGFDAKSDIVNIISSYVEKISKKLPDGIQSSHINNLISKIHMEFKSIQV